MKNLDYASEINSDIQEYCLNIAQKQRQDCKQEIDIQQARNAFLLNEIEERYQREKLLNDFFSRLLITHFETLKDALGVQSGQMPKNAFHLIHDLFIDTFVEHFLDFPKDKPVHCKHSDCYRSSCPKPLGVLMEMGLLQSKQVDQRDLFEKQSEPEIILSLSQYGKTILEEWQQMRQKMVKKNIDSNSASIRPPVLFHIAQTQQQLELALAV